MKIMKMAMKMKKWKKKISNEKWRKWKQWNMQPVVTIEKAMKSRQRKQ